MIKTARALSVMVAVSSVSAHSQTGGGALTPDIVETRWTDAKVKQTNALKVAHKIQYALPQLRVYDAKGQLVYLLDPLKTWRPNSIGAEIDHAMASHRVLKGPSLQETIAELQMVDGRAAVATLTPVGKNLIFDYWASWCIPCKILEKSLVQWQAQKTAGDIKIVKVEADLFKGNRVFSIKKGPDGKLHKVQMN